MEDVESDILLFHDIAHILLSDMLSIYLYLFTCQFLPPLECSTQEVRDNANFALLCISEAWNGTQHKEGAQ